MVTTITLKISLPVASTFAFFNPARTSSAHFFLRCPSRCQLLLKGQVALRPGVPNATKFMVNTRICQCISPIADSVKGRYLSSAC
uniref:Uncharacterized protein n=1 Tax=Arundo donax TaxID=35708 RepID=A0A0A8XZB7_ARUDO